VRRRGTFVGLASLAAALGAIALRVPFRPIGAVPTESGRAERAAVAHARPGGALAAGRPAGAGERGTEAPPARPASLRGTSVDGGLVVDAAGHFVPTPDARRFFDYFFAASGEEPEATIVARIRAEIDRRLAPDAAREAQRLLDRYLDYRARARAYAEAAGAIDDLETRLAAIEAIRVEALGGAAASAFFAEEEAADRAALERLRLASRDDLTEGERERRMAALEEALPAAELVQRRGAEIALDLRRDEAALLAAGGSADQLRTLRERTVGPEAAARLAVLDRQRAEWRQRVDSYRAARAAIEGDASFDAAARARAIDQLRADRFSATERLRVAALDRDAR